MCQTIDLIAILVFFRLSVNNVFVDFHLHTHALFEFKLNQNSDT